MDKKTRTAQRHIFSSKGRKLRFDKAMLRSTHAAVKFLQSRPTALSRQIPTMLNEKKKFFPSKVKSSNSRSSVHCDFKKAAFVYLRDIVGSFSLAAAASYLNSRKLFAFCLQNLQHSELFVNDCLSSALKICKKAVQSLPQKMSIYGPRNYAYIATQVVNRAHLIVTVE